MKNITPFIRRAAVISGLAFGAFALSVFAWDAAPTGTPPACPTDPTDPQYRAGCNAPLNTAYGLQTKQGYLDIVGKVSAGVANTYGLIVENGNVGFGTLTPTTKLHVIGTTTTSGLVVSGGSPATGKVLTSMDASGNVGWSTVAGATAIVYQFPNMTSYSATIPLYDTVLGSNVFTAHGNVQIKQALAGTYAGAVGPGEASRFFDDQSTMNHLCSHLKPDAPYEISYIHGSWSSPGDNGIIYWDAGRSAFVRQYNGNGKNSFVDATKQFSCSSIQTITVDTSPPPPPDNPDNCGVGNQQCP